MTVMPPPPPLQLILSVEISKETIWPWAVPRNNVLDGDDTSAAAADDDDRGTKAAARIASGTGILLGGPQLATHSSVTLAAPSAARSRAQFGLRVMMDAALEDKSVRRDAKR